MVIEKLCNYHLSIYFLIWPIPMTMLLIRDNQQSITAKLCTFIYHLMIIVTGVFSKKAFFYYFLYFYFLEIVLNDLELVILEYKHIYKTKNKSVFFLSVCFLLVVSYSFCVLMLSTFSHFSTFCKHTGWVCSLFDSCFAITLCNNALYLLYLDRFIKGNSFPCQFSQWSLNFLNIRLTSAEIRMSKLSEVWYKDK